MAEVPMYDNFQVLPAIAPQQRAHAATAPAYGANQLKEFGHVIEGVGRMGMGFAIEAKQRADTVRSDDALNRFLEKRLYLTHDKEAGFTNIKGAAALSRDGGQTLEQEYSALLQKEYQDIYNGLGNDDQRRMFANHAGRIMANFKGDLMRHESGEYRNYQTSVSKGVISTAQRTLALEYGEPGRAQDAVARIRAESYRLAQLQGKSAEECEVMARHAVSVALRQATNDILINGDIYGAKRFIEGAKPFMEAGDYLSAYGKTMDMYDTQSGRDMAVRDSGGDTAKLIPSPTRVVANAFGAAGVVGGVTHMESRGRHWGKDGRILKGPKTRYGQAVGKYQMMEGTAKWAAEKSGIGWDRSLFMGDLSKHSKEEIEAYHDKLGPWLINYLLKKHDGDVEKTCIEYNAGGKWVQKCIDARAKNGGTLIQYAPKETQGYYAGVVDYVRKQGGALSVPAQTAEGGKPAPREKAVISGVGGFKRRADMTEADIVRQVDSMQFRTEAQKRAYLSERLRRFRLNKQALAQADKETINTILTHAIDNDGDMSDPRIQNLLADMKQNDPMKYLQLERVIKSRQEMGETPRELYNNIFKPGYLEGLTEEEFLALPLSKADFRRFAPMYWNAQAKKDNMNAKTLKADDPNVVSRTTLDNFLKEVVNLRFTDAKEMPDSLKAELKIAVFNAAVAEQKALNRRLTDQELRKVVDNTVSEPLFPDAVKARPAWLSLLVGSVPILGMSWRWMFSTPPTVKGDTLADVYSQLSPKERERFWRGLADAFERKNGRPHRTVGELVRFYRLEYLNKKGIESSNGASVNITGGGGGAESSATVGNDKAPENAAIGFGG